MDNYMSIFNGILSTDGTFLDIYLDGLDEHRKFSAQNNDEAGVLQHITSLMTTTKTRPLGLRLLDKLLENCSVEALEKKGNLWITLLLKACNNQELERNGHIIFQVLNKLVKNSQRIPDMGKAFVNVHISKVYESATNAPTSKTKYALKCIETCLREYPGSSGPFRGVIERFLWKNVDHIDFEVVQNCGKCLHLLQQVKGGGIQGINHKTQWKNYQLQLLGGIHDVYNAMFANCVELYDEKIEKESLPWQSELNEFNDEPVKKSAQMYIRCRNLLAYLSIALRESFPVEKPILVKKVLNVIVRGLGVNCLMLEKNPIADNIALSVLLPNMHLDLLNLLCIVLTILRGHILLYAELILGLIVDSLKWTSMKNLNASEKNMLSLRKKVYETTTLWCKMLKSGSLCETVAEHLFNEIQEDITPALHEFTLKVLSGARKHMSKKARKQLQSIQNEKPKPSKNQSETSNGKQQELCLAALHCLQEIITSVGNFLKPTILKIMQNSILKICASFYELPLSSSHLYSDINCRVEIYNALYSMLMAAHHLCPPPTDLILKIIQTANARDNSFKVRAHCGVLLRNIEKLVHPQKEGLLFTIEARDIRNTFIKLGQEQLLDDFGLNVSNALESDTTDKDIVLEVSSSENSLLEDDNEFQANRIPAVHTNEDEIIQEKLGVQEVSSVPEHNEVIQTETVPDDTDSIDDERITTQLSDTEQIVSELNTTPDVEAQLKPLASALNNENDVNTIIANKETEDDLAIPVTDEPETKRAKLDDETKEPDVPKNIINLDEDEDIILADIEAEFVDELN